MEEPRIGSRRKCRITSFHPIYQWINRKQQQQHDSFYNSLLRIDGNHIHFGFDFMNNGNAVDHKRKVSDLRWQNIKTQYSFRMHTAGRCSVCLLLRLTHWTCRFSLFHSFDAGYRLSMVTCYWRMTWMHAMQLPSTVRSLCVRIE